MRAVAVLAVTLALAGCAAEPTAGASPAPAATPTGQAFASLLASSPSPIPAATTTGLLPGAVLVDATSKPASYAVSLIAADGGLQAQVNGAKRTAIATGSGIAVDLPYVSTSLTTLYYLDGDSQVRKLTPKGSRDPVVALPVSRNMEGAFAVSPDDGRLAFATLDFNHLPVIVRLGTINLSNGVETDIFSSDSDYVWPVAWHDGLLVLAHAAGPYLADAGSSGAFGNPYNAISYHLVDPSTAQRKVVMGACTVSGALSAAGSACLQGSSLDWSGTLRQWNNRDSWVTASSPAALSPDGSVVAAQTPDHPNQLGFYQLDGSVGAWIVGSSPRYWPGWLDASTVLAPNPSGGTWVLHLQGGEPATTSTAAVIGYFAGTLPTAIS